MGNGKFFRGERIQEWVDKDWKETMRTIAVERVKKNLEKDTISIRELTRMSLNADSFPNLLNELSSKPRKKNE
jgi:hypothetical protein